jgi:hypothetical protein
MITALGGALRDTSAKRPSDTRPFVIAWMFSAVNTIEPFILNLATIDLFNAD